MKPEYYCRVPKYNERTTAQLWWKLQTRAQQKNHILSVLSKSIARNCDDSQQTNNSRVKYNKTKLYGQVAMFVVFLLSCQCVEEEEILVVLSHILTVLSHTLIVLSHSNLPRHRLRPVAQRWREQLYQTHLLLPSRFIWLRQTHAL